VSFCVNTLLCVSGSAIIFFFQAEDGIRDRNVTGVQTCALPICLFMAFNIGGNDVANSFGTSVGAGTLTMKQALVVAAVFEVSGAILAGGSVTETVRSGIVDIGGL